MKLTRTLKISEQEFYDYLEQELITSIQACTQREISAKDIKKGLKYFKDKDKGFACVEISIIDYQRGSLYKSSAKSGTDNISISYETKVEKDGLHVVFHQIVQSYEEKKHNKLMKIFSDTIYLSRMSETIYGIQSKIQAQREANATK